MTHAITATKEINSMIACGNPAHKFRWDAPNERYHHLTVAEVRACYAADNGLQTVEDAIAEADSKAEARAELAYETHLETNDQYRWECDQDELRALAFA